MTTPLRQLVLKIHSRCDLACDHCYVYEHEDTTWASLPKVISEDTAELVARRFAEYAQSEQLDEVAVILHGGEPLLAGPARLRAVCERLVAHLTPVTRLDLRIHTNGVQLSRTHLDLFDEFDVKVGISLDGDKAANDRHRLDRRGRSSYDRVLRAVDLLREERYRHLYLGLLCTVDIANDPVAVHDALTALEPPRIDYLLPHATWDHPPDRTGSETPYADWLLAAFDRWEEQGRQVSVRLFESVLSTLGGGPSLTESLGLAPSDLAVIETDGSFEQADSLKTAYDGAASTGFDVRRHTFTTLTEHPGVQARQAGVGALADECRSCPVLDSCGGGLYAHRYRTGSGFANPSVYCRDLLALIQGVARRITDWETSPAVLDPTELDFGQRELNRTLLSSAAIDRPVWKAFVAMDSGAGAQVLDTLLAQPYVRTSLLTPDPARLAEIALAAGVRAGADVRIGWPGGTRLHLPTLGTLTLDVPLGPVDVECAPDGAALRVRDGEREFGVALAGPGWRPVPVLDDAGSLLDDADPYRDRFAAPLAGRPTDDAGQRAFAALWRKARRLLDERVPGHDVGALTVTPLAPGAGVHPAAHGEPALGVAPDAEPDAVALGAWRAHRAARLRALRECADLCLAGSPAARLIDEAEHWTATARYTGDGTAAARARDALSRISGDQLTGSGKELVCRLTDEVPHV
ncbi:FxsB family cyclophane-forming radical SAM/SPASM peptide maturase [Streptomyces sp. VRA16 Mangrove soil]|uniref:FxsB family cyclophane-forming radical SAM/SPASM peptide maturase n=1 Tax=Streptomyces sp. VRA16 Mangrove soil TaxID=2817434 RepID=UPI001A9D56FA|nr:FxsB family cyclophane-forming radical SAM/SPASM peptide maturase [Streptomyces sp. VRA16 Mangrove soil]MBO1335096.1 FxsB family radical SAM/SPASM domain protein [Streptomyces sp. VRA16 Mangrove soil]